MECDKYLHIHGTKNGVTVEEIEPFGIWIPCSERLPEKGLRVLMQLNNAWQIVGWYDKEEADWYELTSEEPLDSNYRVLAWMPLPKYESEGER